MSNNLNFLEKWFIRKCRWAWENYSRIQATEDLKGSPMNPAMDRKLGSNKCVRFAIFPANGGFVIEHHSNGNDYITNNKVSSSGGTVLTIVGDSSKLGETIEHIITLEALKH